jgi:hypothetical protein
MMMAFNSVAELMVATLELSDTGQPRGMLLDHVVLASSYSMCVIQYHSLGNRQSPKRGTVLQSIAFVCRAVGWCEDSWLVQAPSLLALCAGIVPISQCWHRKHWQLQLQQHPYAQHHAQHC